MKPHYIHRLIAEGEHQRLDFKFEISDARKIARTFVAFANTNGGKLLIGVNDNGTIAGIRSSEEIYMAEKAKTLYCRPPVDITVREWIVDGKKVLEIRVPESDNKPHYMLNEQDQWRIYVRIIDQDHLANKTIVQAFLKKASSKGVYLIYSEYEKKLLEYLKDHPSVTEEEFTLLASISRKKAIDIISSLLAIGILEYHLTDDHYAYSLIANEPDLGFPG